MPGSARDQPAPRAVVPDEPAPTQPVFGVAVVLAPARLAPRGPASPARRSRADLRCFVPPCEIRSLRALRCLCIESEGKGCVNGVGALAVLVWVVWLSANGLTSAPSPGQQDEKQAGLAMYDRVCKVCHGPEGRGDSAPRLVPFTREYEEVLGIVREGTGQMPPISARQLPDEGVRQIVGYLSGL